MSKGKMILIGAITVVVLLMIIMIASLPVWGDTSNADQVTDIPRMQQDEEFSIEDMTTFVTDDYEGEDGIGPDEKLSITDLLKEKMDARTSTYDNENDPRIARIQREIDSMESYGSPAPSASYGGRSVGSQNFLTEAEKESQYRAELLKAREERLARSQDYSSPDNGASGVSVTNTGLEFEAAIYRDQFVLPGDRVTLILTHPVTYKGNVFKKNTFLYANANISGSRILMNITNIDHVPVTLEVRDISDGDLGMYSERAGELWREFQADAQSQGVNDVAGQIAQSANVPLVGTAIRAFGQFFRKKKYREKDKILLVGDHKLLLASPL